ncbi:signaling lymphocytic activation molecule-like [Pelodytes ibericus]
MSLGCRSEFDVRSTVVVDDGEGMVVGSSSLLTVSGSLGKPLILPAGELKNISKVFLKRKKGDTNTKLLGYDLESKKHILNHTNYHSFSETDGTVIFVGLHRDDEGEYQLVKEIGVKELIRYVNIKVYEEITNISVTGIQNHQNDTCAVRLTCMVGAGDNVTFSWSRNGQDLNHNSSMLQLSLSSGNVTDSYTCTAKNPVSELHIGVKPMMECTAQEEQGWRINDIYMACGLTLVGLILLSITFILFRLLNKQKKMGRFSLNSQETVPTVYASVQRAQITCHANTAPQPVPVTEVHMTVYELAGHFTRDGGTDQKHM